MKFFYSLYCRTKVVGIPQNVWKSTRLTNNSKFGPNQKHFSPYACCVRSLVYALISFSSSHDVVIKWKHFPRYWPFVRPVTRSFDVIFDLHLNQRLSNILVFFFWYCRPWLQLSGPQEDILYQAKYIEGCGNEEHLLPLVQTRLARKYSSLFYQLIYVIFLRQSIMASWHRSI